jgi:hypothetical protein
MKGSTSILEKGLSPVLVFASISSTIEKIKHIIHELDLVSQYW